MVITRKYFPTFDEIWDADQGMGTRIAAEFKRVKGFVPYEPGFIYLMQAQDTNYFKIGKSINPDQRLLQVYPKMPFRTKLAKVWRSSFMSYAEKLMHEIFEAYRTNGEWFELSDIQLFILLREFDYEYEDAIRSAYGYFFCKNIGLTPEKVKHIKNYYGYKENETYLDCGAYNSSAEAIAWIESLFTFLEKTNMFNLGSLQWGVDTDLMAHIDTTCREAFCKRLGRTT